MIVAKTQNNRLIHIIKDWRIVKNDRLAIKKEQNPSQLINAIIRRKSEI